MEWFYDEVKNLAADKDGVFYVVGSGEFLVQNIEVLREQGITLEQTLLDKHERKLAEFLSLQLSLLVKFLHISIKKVLIETISFQSQTSF